MRNRTSWIFGVIVAVAAFHMYTRRADTGEGSPGKGAGGLALSSEAEGPAGPATGAGGGPVQGQAPGQAKAGEPREAEPVKAAADPDEPKGAAGEATGLRREGLEALMQGDEARGALALFRASRARTQSPDRDEAAAKLAELERGAIERAAKAKAAGAGLDERAALTAAYLACVDPAKRAAHRARLDELVGQYILSPRAVECADVHVVAKGDSLAKIAAKYNFPIEGIQRTNRLASTALKIGERLKVPKGPVEVLVVKAEFRLTILLGGLFLKEFPIGTGKEGCTPETTFLIEDKIKEPTWHSKEGVFPFGHPKNILGTRWLAFKNSDEHRGFGIHGTAYPSSIGTEASSGCIRMRNADVEELFGYVPKGATVWITR